MKPWGRLLCCTLLLTATAGCPWEHDGGDDEIDINVSSYADFQSGGSWDYDGTTHNNTLTLTYKGLQSVAGYAYQVAVLQEDSGKLLYFDGDLSDRLYLVGTSEDGPYDEQLPLLRSSFDPNKSYGPYTTDDSDCRSYVSYARTNVDVPYDYFDRAILTTVTTECKGIVPRTYVEKYWFGKDTGLVKWYDKDGDTWYLTDRNN